MFICDKVGEKIIEDLEEKRQETVNYPTSGYFILV